MRTLTAAVLVISAAGVVSAQQQPDKKPTTLTLTGCVQKGETHTGGFTLVDGTDTYRLTGVDVRDYVGRRVQVVGGAPRKLKIVGGLLPSATVAGQAGAMDPSRKATAAAGAAAANGTGTPEFRVRSIRPMNGSCPQ